MGKIQSGEFNDSDKWTYGDELSVKPKKTTRHFECVKFLLEQGTNVDCRDLCGYTPLHHCTGVFGNERSLKFAQYIFLLREQRSIPGTDLEQHHFLLLS
jgi:hypothetical protein